MVDTMPASFVPLYKAIGYQQVFPFGVFNDIILHGRPVQPPPAIAIMAPFQTALAAEYPTLDDQILALLSWYGSGLGPWSGYPAYEDFPTHLLDVYPITELLGVITSHTLTAVQMEGAARYLADDISLHGDIQARKLLPASLKQEFIKRALQSGDSDKILRAENAFS